MSIDSLVEYSPSFFQEQSSAYFIALAVIVSVAIISFFIGFKTLIYGLNQGSKFFKVYFVTLATVLFLNIGYGIISIYSLPQVSQEAFALSVVKDFIDFSASSDDITLYESDTGEFVVDYLDELYVLQNDGTIRQITYEGEEIDE